MKRILAIVLAGTSAMAIAAGHPDADKQYELKDGSTVYVYKDGKMAMEDKLGRPMSMKQGSKMELKDGNVIEMRGNEIWRRDWAKPRG